MCIAPRIVILSEAKDLLFVENAQSSRSFAPRVKTRSTQDDKSLFPSRPSRQYQEPDGHSPPTLILALIPAAARIMLAPSSKRLGHGKSL